MSENKESSAAKTSLAERPRIAAQVRKRKLGEVLQERGHVSQHNLTRAMQEQAGKTFLLGELLLGRGLVSKDEAQQVLKKFVRLASAFPSPPTRSLSNRKGRGRRSGT